MRLQPFHQGTIKVGTWILAVELTGCSKKMTRIEVNGVCNGREAGIVAILVNTGYTKTEG
jgi:hypothetical protein